MKALALLLALTATAAAQHTIDWHTIDGGGGSGAAGSFAMHGTLGQPDAFSGAAGSVVFVGGYWSLLDEPIPLLRIFQTGADIVLAWPNPSPGFGLQTSPDLVVPSWVPVTIAPVKVGSEFQVTWGPPDGRRFFRLHRP
jgi:hypothetical protein